MHESVVLADGTQLGENVTIYPFTVIGRKPKRVGKMYRALDEDLHPAVIGNNCVIGCFTVIYKGATIGNNVFIGDHVWIREKVEIGDESVIGQGVNINYNSKIGKGVRIMNGTHITGNCSIGNDCWIGTHVVTMNDRSFSVDDPHIGPAIGNNVLIGSGAIIFPGVTIGTGAQIGAGTIVREDVQDYTLVYGQPLKTVILERKVTLR